MYWTLHKPDMAFSPDDGQSLTIVQTDHREPSEIEAQREVSILFALTKVFGGFRFSFENDQKASEVRYSMVYTPPPFFIHAVLSAGGVFELMDGTEATSEQPLSPVADIADKAFQALAAEVAEREGIDYDANGIEILEGRIAGRRLSLEDEDEVGEYWQAILELAAVTGESLRQIRPEGRWVEDTHGISGTIPFVFHIGERGSLNPAGKADNFMNFGEEETSRKLLLLASEEPMTADGPLLVTFKPADWSFKDQMVCEPLLGHGSTLAEDVPLVVYGHDQPQTFAMLKAGEEARDLAQLRAQALENLAEIDVTIEKHDLDGLPLTVVQGSYFATEKILDVAFMNSLHEQLGSPLLAVGVPVKHMMLVTSAIQDPDQIMKFMAVCAGYWSDGGAKAICPAPLLVTDGKVTGLATPKLDDGDEPATPARRKSFWKRLFGK